MAFDAKPIMDVLKKMGKDDLDILAAELLPALEAEINQLFPPTVAAGAQTVEALINPQLQSALKSLVDKIVL